MEEQNFLLCGVELVEREGRASRHGLESHHQCLGSRANRSGTLAGSGYPRCKRDKRKGRTQIDDDGQQANPRAGVVHDKTKGQKGAHVGGYGCIEQDAELGGMGSAEWRGLIEPPWAGLG